MKIVIEHKTPGAGNSRQEKQGIDSNGDRWETLKFRKLVREGKGIKEKSVAGWAVDAK